MGREAHMPTHQKPRPLSQLQLGDLVLIDGDLGRVVGVRYGQIACDVPSSCCLPQRCTRACPLGVASNG
jgi:hypothetical protein